MKEDQDPFENYATQYDAWFDAESKRPLFLSEVKLFQTLIGPLSGRWMEIGVGTGRFAQALGIKEGVEPSAEMRALAQTRNILTTNGTGECLPYPDTIFDGVLITTTFCFLSDPLQTLKESYRVLKESGRLIIGIVPANSSWGRLYANKGAKGHPLYSAATFYLPSEIIDLSKVSFHYWFVWMGRKSCGDSRWNDSQP
jgi:ubiquinone/menaquinone biosynthesis C-methylase UbiE